MHQKDADGIANSEDPVWRSLICVCTVCPDLSVQKVRIITVFDRNFPYFSIKTYIRYLLE